MGRPVDSVVRKRPGSLPKGNRNACVAPVSALELCRRSMKRKRGMQLQLQLQTQLSRGERESSFARNNSSNNNSNNNAALPLPLCLLQRPGLSLPPGLTELAGPAGAGKTQLALSLCADCVQHHSSARAVYLSLGGSGRSLQRVARRLRDMLRARDSRWRCSGSGSGSGSNNGSNNNSNNNNNNNNSSNNNTSSNTDTNDNASKEWVHGCLTRVLVHWVCNTEELTDVLLNRLPLLLRRHHPTVSVVVLDGIASLFRLLPEEQVAGMGNSNNYYNNNNNNNNSNNNNNNSNSTINPWHDRAVAFFELSNLCKELSSRFGIPVLVVNECTSKIVPDGGTGSSSAGFSFSRTRPVLVPALGLAWSQCVNASFFVVRKPGTARVPVTVAAGAATETETETETATATDTASPTAGGGWTRVLRCLKAPHISSERPGTEFWIDRSGTTAFPARNRVGWGTPR